MKILAIDTSAKSASVALTEDDFLISESFVNIGLTHSETLMPMIESTLKNAAVSFDEVDSLAVTVGPGSFTGIRIGVSAVKGLAQPKNLLCAGVSTLEAMAYTLDDYDGIICCVMDARCSQVYTALFSCRKKTIKRLSQDIAISLQELYNILKDFKENIILTGDGANVCYNFFKDNLNNVSVANGLVKYQRAYGAVLAALSTNGKFCNCDILNPVYIRPPQAERELKKKKGE